MLSQPKLVEPILIAGLPSIGDIGRIAAKFLRDFLQAELFAELYSPTLPDYVCVDKKGVCHIPKYDFYFASKNHDFIILVGDSQPALEDLPAYYEICSDILGFASKVGSTYIATLAGTPVLQSEKEVYVVATSKNLIKECIEKGAVTYKGKTIMGLPGLLLGIAKKKGLKGVCLLGSTSSLTVDREAAFRVYRLLRKVLGIDTQESLVS